MFLSGAGCPGRGGGSRFLPWDGVLPSCGIFFACSPGLHVFYLANNGFFGIIIYWNKRESLPFDRRFSFMKPGARQSVWAECCSVR